MLPTAHFIDEENKAQDMMSPTQDQDHTAEHLGPKAGPDHCTACLSSTYTTISKDTAFPDAVP